MATKKPLILIAPNLSWIEANTIPLLERQLGAVVLSCSLELDDFSVFGKPPDCLLLDFDLDWAGVNGVYEKFLQAFRAYSPQTPVLLVTDTAHTALPTLMLDGVSRYDLPGRDRHRPYQDRSERAMSCFEGLAWTLRECMDAQPLKT